MLLLLILLLLLQGCNNHWFLPYTKVIALLRLTSLGLQAENLVNETDDFSIHFLRAKKPGRCC